MRTAALLAAALLLARAAAAAEAPPPEILQDLSFFQSLAETEDDGLWEDFEVLSSTEAVPDDAPDKEEAVP